MKSLFARGYRGLSDSVFSGPAGSVFKSVGIDSRSKPGVLQAHQRLIKDSGTTIGELCEVSLDVSDGSRLWFSSESGKVWREVSGTYTLITTFELSDWDVLSVAYTGASLTVESQISAESYALGFYATAFENKFLAARYFGDTLHQYLDDGDTYQLSNLTYDAGYDHSAQVSNARGYFIKSDASAWWTASSDTIYQYTSGANGDIPGSSYDSVSYTVSESSDIRWFTLNDDGTKLFVADGSSGPTLYQYTLSTAYNISTATYDSVSLDTSAVVDFNSGGISFTPDGMSLIFLGTAVSGTTAETLMQYNLTTAYDLSTATFHRKAPFRNVFSDRADKIYIQSIPSLGIYPAETRIYTGGSATTLTESGSSSGSETVYEATILEDNGGSIVLGAEEQKTTFPGEFEESYVFADNRDDLPSCVICATEKLVFKMKVSELPTVDGNIAAVGQFENGASQHPTIRQNNSVFFGDGNVVAELDNFGSFVPVTNFNLPANETVTALAPLDLDILVGTQVKNHGRVLRWDGISETTSAEDIIYEKGGVRAFIEDDNYVYPVIGQRGSIYYYNGSKCEDFLTIPEVGNGEALDVKKNAVGFYQGTPLFGVSNDTSNPVLQGIYGYGSYNTNYARSLSLDYPMPSGEFSGVTIGSIVVDGDDLYVSWKDATDVGIAKIDLTTKYASAYFETINLTPPMNRHQAKTISDVMVPYYALPASTGVTIGVDKDYSASFASMDVVTDTVRKFVKLKSPSVPDTVNPRLRVGLTTNVNDSPEIEDVLFSIAPTGSK